MKKWNTTFKLDSKNIVMKEKTNIKLIIAYDGTSFHGWQKTKMGPSIEETLQKSLEKILQEGVTLQAASRTDAGVHAAGQVVNFYASQPNLRKLHQGLRGLLPKEISVLQIEEASPNFHPTLDNTGKEYHYNFCLSGTQLPFYRNFSWHVHTQLDIAAMEKGASLLIGTHDFSAFSSEPAINPSCTLTSITFFHLPQNRFQISLIGSRFLYKMVRTLVGTLFYIGIGKINWKQGSIILESKARTSAGMTAPAHGLFLKQVFYEKSPECKLFPKLLEI